MRAARFLGDEKIGMVEVPEPQPGLGKVVLDVAFAVSAGRSGSATVRGSTWPPAMR